MKMIMKAAALAAATTIGAAGAALAADEPEMPSALECKSGYKDGMRWTKQEFDAACKKIATNAVPAGQTK